MSEATRAIALQEAVKNHGSAEASIILKTATAFEAFLSGTTAPASAAPESGEAPAAAPRRGRPPGAASKPPAPAPAPAPAAAPADDEAKKAMVAAIGEMAKVNRTGCMEILAEFGAKSASSVKPEDYEAVTEALNNALLAV